MKLTRLIPTTFILCLLSCQNRFYTKEDFQLVPKIDSHIHINSNDGTFEDQAAKDNFILITLGVDHSDSANIRKQFDDAVSSVRKHPGKVFFGPTFRFDTAGWGTKEWSEKIISQLGKDISAGAITVKIWKNIGMTVRDKNGKFIMVDDPGLDPVIEFIKSKGLPVTGHLGEPRNCWLPLDQMTVKSDSSYFARNPQYHMFLHPEYPSYEDQIKARDNLLKKHPVLTFIGCHLGSLEWNVDSLAARFEKFPNMAADMSARICHLQYQSARDRERVRNFIIKYQDRLLYGTDVGYSGSNNPDGFKKQMHDTWIDDWKYFATDEEMTSEKFAGKFTGLKLPKDVVNKIYSRNAIKWYKLPEQKTTNLKFHAWAPTPPMGWNSWDCFGPTVVESEIKANADYMAKNLKKFGWKYIVVDIRWYVENDKSGGYNQTDPRFVIDKYGRLQPAVNRFPSSANGKGFKPLADYIHAKGLKFGIHVMRGIPVLAVKNNLPVLGTDVTAGNISSTEGQCRWLRDMYTVVAGKTGAQEYYNSIIDLYASWGVDFLKIDDLSSPYHAEEIEMIRKAIDRCGREIVLSTSPGPTPLELISHIEQNANMWRTVGDFWDNWPQLKEQFEVLERWAPYVAPGKWPDGDMLPLGHIGIRAERGKDRKSGFTKDEQYTVMTLFAIFRSPLMFGGNLPDNDEFTNSLITNKNVLYVNQHSINNKQLFRNNDLIAWIADDPKNGDKYMALFNASDSEGPVEISVRFDQLGLSGTHSLTDLWTGEKIGEFSGEFSRSVNRHGAGLYRIH